MTVLKTALLELPPQKSSLTELQQSRYEKAVNQEMGNIEAILKQQMVAASGQPSNSVKVDTGEKNFNIKKIFNAYLESNILESFH